MINLFRKSVHCGPDPKTVKAEPKDLNIVCGEISVEIENQFFSLEKEVMVEILSNFLILTVTFIFINNSLLDFVGPRWQKTKAN